MYQSWNYLLAKIVKFHNSLKLWAALGKSVVELKNWTGLSSSELKSLPLIHQLRKFTAFHEAMGIKNPGVNIPLRSLCHPYVPLTLFLDRRQLRCGRIMNIWIYGANRWFMKDTICHIAEELLHLINRMLNANTTFGIPLTVWSSVHTVAHGVCWHTKLHSRCLHWSMPKHDCYPVAQIKGRNLP